jgi:hypothetical protein
VSMLRRATAWKTAVGVLGGCGLAVVVVTGASATATKSATPPPVDHQLCYSALSRAYKVPTGRVRLINQFSPNGFVPHISHQAVLHCNPVMKTIQLPAGPQVYKVTNPAAHLACLPITEPITQPIHIVSVQNQFGQAVMQTGQPNLLCLPSWKGLTGPPHKAVNHPPGLNHFTCYPVTPQGAYKPPPVILLRDEFSTKNVPVQVQPEPQELCLPTKKIVTVSATSTKTYPIINPVLHLLCFGVSPTPIKPAVWDQNQFGTAKVSIRATKWLCLPSTKQLIH